MSSSSKSKKPAFANTAAKKPQPQQAKAPAKPQPKGVPFKPANKVQPAPAANKAKAPVKNQPAPQKNAQHSNRPQPKPQQAKAPAAKPQAKGVPFKAVQHSNRPQPKPAQSKQPVKPAATPNKGAFQPKPQQAKAPAAKPQAKGVPFKAVQHSNRPQPKPAQSKQPAKPQPKGVPFKAAVQPNRPQQQQKQPVKPQAKGVPFKAAVQPKPQQPVKAQQPQQRPQPQKENIKNIQNQPKSKTVTIPGKATMTPDKNKTPQKVQAPVKPQAPQQAKTQPAQSAEFSRETLAILFKAAKKASEHAYAPYSRFKVGAVLLLEDGRGEASQISAYTGCNVENASYGLTCCAERIAIYKAVSDGNKKFKAMILYASAKKPVSPCGACRQVLAEFAPPDMKIYSIGQFKDEDVARTPYAIYTVAELLPHGFKASDFIEKK